MLIDTMPVMQPVGIAHMGGHNTLNHSFSYDVARKVWRALPLPPLTRTYTSNLPIACSF